ncbi:HAD family phosphatase [Vagococcus sp. BWB3-3]|uniref:HAD family phosphatase n=1 Tax=Vagococcus allomyrinae TaxID=2794353 RepID=A0A940PGR8_9ENTE|nr:Cof-type HAD-IIB family hydrolase [Vagococcus allomyrinae]MBP1044559.1 HAD family phosphatase [Vagococcus allomyrinae]
MYKLIVSDLDETLINSQGVVSQENLRAIQKAQALGLKFVPATGRSFNDFQHILKMTGVHDLENEYAISYNGGVITENKHNRLLTSTALPFELVEHIFDLGVKHDVLIHLFTLSDIHTLNMNSNEKEYLDGHIDLKLLDQPRITHLSASPILKINFQHLNLEFLKEIEASLSKEIAETLDINYSSNRYLEFNPRGVNKGNALQQLITMLDVSTDQILAIGDNMNDRTMIQLAGTGVAVANAVPELKELANYHCLNDHNHHAVAEAIERFIL